MIVFYQLFVGRRLIDFEIVGYHLSGNNQIWHLQCYDCGLTTHFHRTQISRGKKCQCRGIGYLENFRTCLKNKRSGKLKAIKWVRSDKENNFWLCECDCGNTKEVAAYNFPKQKSCGRCKGKFAKGAMYEGEISGAYLSVIRKNARIRGIEYNMLPGQLWQLFLDQNRKCALTGRKLCFSEIRTEHTASLDRIDSKKGYVLDNVQWTHKDVNRMKWHFKQEEFIKICQEVFEFQESRVNL